METKLMSVSGAKTKVVNKRAPRIRLSGNWLDTIGFEGGKLAAAQYDHGSILLRAHDSDNYRNLVRGAYKTGAGLFQVRQTTHNRKLTSYIEIKGARLEPLGFTIGSVIAVQYEHGFIKITLIDLDQPVNN
jgi:hypothetical protein